MSRPPIPRPAEERIEPDRAHREAVQSDPVCDAARRLLDTQRPHEFVHASSCLHSVADVRLVAEAVMRDARSAETAETRASSELAAEARKTAEFFDRPSSRPGMADRGFAAWLLRELADVAEDRRGHALAHVAANAELARREAALHAEVVRLRHTLEEIDGVCGPYDDGYVEEVKRIVKEASA